MKITSKTVKINVELPVDNCFIEAKLKEMGITPLRWAIVEIEDNKSFQTLTISLACESL